MSIATLLHQSSDPLRLSHGQPRRKGDGVRPMHDLYPTPPEYVRALLAQLKADGQPIRDFLWWEPAQGFGDIVSEMRAEGCYAVGTDLTNHRGDPGFRPIDFLLERRLWAGTNAIITNPPFGRLMTQFAAHAVLRLKADWTLMLLPLTFLASQGREDLVGESSCLQEVFVFAERCTFWPGGVPVPDPRTGKINSGKGSYAWFSWRQGHAGGARLRRISWAPFCGDQAGRIA